MYAIWKEGTYSQTITITYNKNGGTGSMTSSTGTAVFYSNGSLKSSASITLKSCSFTRSGYTFQGWATTSGATSPTYYANSTYSFSSNTTLYAVWKSTTTTKTITITYNKNGGTGSMTSSTGTATFDGNGNCTKKASIAIKSCTFTRSGYTFQGWGTSSSSTSATYQAGSTYSFSANTTLYAVWKQNAASVTKCKVSSLSYSLVSHGTGAGTTCTFRVKLSGVNHVSGHVINVNQYLGGSSGSNNMKTVVTSSQGTLSGQTVTSDLWIDYSTWHGKQNRKTVVECLTCGTLLNSSSTISI